MYSLQRHAGRIPCPVRVAADDSQTLSAVASVTIPTPRSALAKMASNRLSKTQSLPRLAAANLCELEDAVKVSFRSVREWLLPRDGDALICCCYAVVH